MGADDYITKPFTPMELLARVNSQLRRYRRFLELLERQKRRLESENIRSFTEKSVIGGQMERETDDLDGADVVYRVGGLELNESTVEVFSDGSQVRLTPMEFKILTLLIRNPGRVFSAEEIYERVWNERAVNTDTVMVHVRNIREKIELNPKKPKYLKVVWGVGYKIEKQP